jgi:hypothetical protein
MKRFIIASAFKSNRSQEHNEVNHKGAQSLLNLRWVDFRPVVGVWEGAKELSLLITITNQEDLEAVRNLFLVWFRQDAILEVNQENDNLAILLFADGNTKYAGQYREVSKAIAERSDCYTLDDGKYYQALETMPAWGSCSKSTQEAAPAALHDRDKTWKAADAHEHAERFGMGSIPGEGLRNKH